MNPRPLVEVALATTAVLHLVWTAAQMTRGVVESSFLGMWAMPGNIVALGLESVVLRFRGKIAARITAPLTDESGHRPRETLLFAGIATLGVHLLIDGVAAVASYIHYLSAGWSPELATFLAQPSVSMALGALLFVLAPLVAQATAPGDVEP